MIIMNIKQREILDCTNGIEDNITCTCMKKFSALLTSMPGRKSFNHMHFSCANPVRLLLLRITSQKPVPMETV